MEISRNPQRHYRVVRVVLVLGIAAAQPYMVERDISLFTPRDRNFSTGPEWNRRRSVSSPSSHLVNLYQLPDFSPTSTLLSDLETVKSFGRDSGWSTTLLNLHRIAVHPDHLGGLGLHRSLTSGPAPLQLQPRRVGLAGAIAEQCLSRRPKSAWPYRFLAPVLIAVFSAHIHGRPYFFLATDSLIPDEAQRYISNTEPLVTSWKRKARTAKWLGHDDNFSDDALTTPDVAPPVIAAREGRFTSLHVRIRPVFSLSTSTSLSHAAALIPCIPVFIAAIPFRASSLEARP